MTLMDVRADTAFGFQVILRKPLSSIRYHCPDCKQYVYEACHANTVEAHKDHILQAHRKVCSGVT
jgi:hypothetical protein